MPLWAKVDVDMPTDEKLFGQPLATRHLWTCLICLAKRQDHAGAINGFNCALLASRFNVPRKSVAAALTHYQAARMVELDPDGTIRLLHFVERQGPADTSNDRSSRYYESHRETISAKRKVSRRKSHGGLTAVSRETFSLEGEKEEEEEVEGEVEGEVENSKKQKPSQGATAVPAPTTAVWNAYSAAYEERYHEKPVRNATVNGQLAHLLTRIPAAEAPGVAAYYVNNNDAYYVKKGHSVKCLIGDVEKLRTEWATGRQITGTEALQQEKSQANLTGWAKHLKEVENGS